MSEEKFVIHFNICLQLMNLFGNDDTCPNKRSRKGQRVKEEKKEVSLIE